MASESLGRNREAIPHLERSLKLDDDGSIHYALARAYQAIGDTDHSRSLMRTYQEIVNRNREVDDQLAKEAEITPPVLH
jgi:tetratricopeptide (TPR) repeat protein